MLKMLKSIKIKIDELEKSKNIKNESIKLKSVNEN